VTGGHTLKELHQAGGSEPKQSMDSVKRTKPVAFLATGGLRRGGCGYVA